MPPTQAIAPAFIRSSYLYPDHRARPSEDIALSLSPYCPMFEDKIDWERIRVREVGLWHTIDSILADILFNLAGFGPIEIMVAI